MSSKKVDLKVVFLGDSGVGKTCLLIRFLHGSFGNTTATIGASFATKDLGLWDTAGQERYDSLSAFYCRGAGCAIIAFDFFKNVQKWVSKLRSSQPDKDCFVILVGTKLDCITDEKIERAVSVEEAKKMAEKIEAISYFETSSKTGDKVQDVFDEVVKNIVKISGSEKKETVVLKDNTDKPGTGTQPGCCG